MSRTRKHGGMFTFTKKFVKPTNVHQQVTPKPSPLEVPEDEDVDFTPPSAEERQREKEEKEKERNKWKKFVGKEGGKKRSTRRKARKGRK